ncbi:hypothetical protein FNH05_01665 [Amycolatopsis rhizosphaerae]|uniref:Uncharacterized protein n=1 Tax=Amycolatopsis rhizosphaerae TaxID=2053003 RepID=A0A558DLR9_9PSEU|nr:hypothetical protein [Amycolatopsis rhizosphaerae]TVT61966.1 hypothetical protein FNH05_01665 [Amycolatopsis rhizosphaerae]
MGSVLIKLSHRALTSSSVVVNVEFPLAWLRPRDQRQVLASGLVTGELMLSPLEWLSGIVGTPGWAGARLPSLERQQKCPRHGFGVACSC